MGLTCTVGGARGTFDERFANEVAGVLDHAFGSENDWEGVVPRDFGELNDPGWSELQERAVATLGTDSVPNLLALGEDGRGVYLPAPLQVVTLPLSAGSPLRCASLPGLRQELSDLAERWDLPLDDQSLHQMLQAQGGQGDGWSAGAAEMLTFARLALAANEAVRSDCPLWLVCKGEEVTLA